VARALRVGAAEYVAKADAIARPCGGDAPAALTALSEEIRALAILSVHTLSG